MPNIHPFPQPAPPLTYQVRFTIPWKGSAPEEVLSETRVGASIETVVEWLGSGQLDHYVLDAVYALDLTPGRLRIVDVTAKVLQQVAGFCDVARLELPSSLEAAFKAHRVAEPMSWVETDFRDMDDEHRLTACELGVGRYA